MPKIRALGISGASVSWLDPSWRSAKGYSLVGQLIEQAAHSFAENGVTLRYHNHAFELERHFEPGAQGLTGFEILANQFHLTRLEPDLGWLAHAGIDLAAWIEKYAEKIDLVHLRDTGVSNGEPATLPFGSGLINWKKLFALPAFSRIEYGFIEHSKSTETPFAVLADCLAFARTLL